jgi:protein TonB
MIASGMSFKASRTERLIDPPTRALDRGYAALLAICFVAHAAAIFLLFQGDSSSPTAPAMEEIPVELVQEPPPEPAPEAPEPPAPPPPQQQALNTFDEAPAFDAPRAPNEEKVERDAPDQPSKSPETASQPQKDVSPPVASVQPTPPAPPAEPQQTASQPPPEDKPDAEIALPELRREEAVQAAPPAAAQPKQKSMAELLASFEPLPDYQFGGAVRPAPVTGGQARTTYLTTLFGMVKTHMRMPPQRPSGGGPFEGEVVFEVDRSGKVLQARVARPSGSRELDSAAIAAIRAASPFPPTPTGTSLGLRYSYSAR